MNPPQYSTCNVMIKSVHLPWKPCQRRVRVRKRSQTGCVKNSPFTAFLLSVLSQNDMQFIPGVFCKPFSLILRCKSPQAMARLSVSQPLEQQGTQTDWRTHRQEDREQCGRLYKDRVGGRLLSGKESWSSERGRQFGKSTVYEGR